MQREKSCDSTQVLGVGERALFPVLGGLTRVSQEEDWEGTGAGPRSQRRHT